uniref:Uncharacterized protein n=1 Tax=Arundo donax TaxID=35708 RepID=A0A0A9AGX1_ARUDO
MRYWKLVISPLCHRLENDFAMTLKRRLPSPLSCFEDADIVVSNMLFRGRFMAIRFLKTSSLSFLWKTRSSLQPSMLKISIATGRS